MASCISNLPHVIVSTSTKSWLWHQRLSHLNFNTINDLARNDLVIGLLKFKYHKEHLCPSCEQGKSKRAAHPPKPIPNTKKRLHLLHMDLCGPMRIASINGKRVYNRRTKKIIRDNEVLTFESISCNVIWNTAVQETLSFKGMTTDKSDPGLDHTYSTSNNNNTTTTKTKIGFTVESMYDDYIGGLPLAATRTTLAAQAPQDVDELKTQQQHVQEQDNKATTSNLEIVAVMLPMLCRWKSGREELLSCMNHFFKGTIDPTLFIRRFDDYILVVQVYVDAILSFGFQRHLRLSQQKNLKEVKKDLTLSFWGTDNIGL
ncbi:retrovirus-related pol polyprotein from transposon TNT 1-94 [Tanacetum coccineum]|uniref:Retrovirus-related pol polyprotein from transposon TNT 1-94 n=1 Tax=Tanacetum coccineum TaxID=301880 RepID=A0ABQ4WRR4_9ASTR